MSPHAPDDARPGAPGAPGEELARLAGPLLGVGRVVLLDLATGAPPLLLGWGPASREPAPSGGAVQTLCASVLQADEPLMVDDARQDLPLRREWGAGDAGLVAFAGVPLRNAYRRHLGVLGVVDAAPRAWTAAELDLLLSLAPGVATLLEHARLAQENARLATALISSDTRHRRLVATCPLPIYSLDRDGCIMDANQATADVTGRPVAELLGMSFADLVAPEDLEFVVTELQGTTSGRDGPSTVECRMVRPTGERRVVQITRAPIECDGEIVGVQGIGRDITDERAREAHFRRVERMASVAPLLSGVCHELNNPLTSIKSFAEFLLLDDRSAEDQEALEIVAREAERAARIVSDLRVVARQSQEAASSCGMVELKEVVEQVVEARRSSLQDAGIELRLDLAPGLIPAWAVRPQIEQVVAHLVTNALQALRGHPEPRTLSLSTYPGDLGVVLQVADSGPGIRAEDLNRIFDPFWTTKVPGEGTGLGLSLVHSIITDHGGRIRVDSNFGAGATFTVDLPAAEAAPAMAETGQVQIAARSSLRVLVVDDEAPIRMSLTRYLERRGHVVAQAAEGGAALEQLGVSTNAAPFDIIVADLRMPGLDGKDFVARLRQRGDGLEHRVVFITGDAESPDVEEFLRESGAPVIWKPFELAEVAQIVEAHAGMSLP